MDTNLSSVGVLFASTIGSGSIQPELTTKMKTSRSHRTVVDDSRHTNKCQADKTDNNRGNGRDKIAEASVPNFSCVLRKEGTRHISPDNKAEIKPPKKQWKNNGAIETKIQLPLLANILALNLSPSVRPQESMKATPALGRLTAEHPVNTETGKTNDTVSTNFVGSAVKRASQPTGNAKQTGLRLIHSDVPKSVLVDLKEQAKSANSKPTAENADQIRAEIGKINKIISTTSTGVAEEKKLGISSSTPANKEKSLISNFLELAHSNAPNSKQKESESPRKSQIATEKTTEQRVVDNCKLKIEAFVSTAQTKTASLDKSGYSFLTCQMAAHSEQSSTLSQTIKIANDTSLSNIAGSISQQIAASIEGAPRLPDTHITIYLNPPELGKVLVRFEQQQDQITILLEVSKPEIRREIELTVPAIMRNLQDTGVQIRRLEVSVASGFDELEQQSDAGAPGQDNSEIPMNQDHFDFAGESDSDPDCIGLSRSSTNDEESFQEWFTSTVKNHYQQDSSAQPLVLTGYSINMLI